MSGIAEPPDRLPSPDLGTLAWAELPTAALADASIHQNALAGATASNATASATLRDGTVTGPMEAILEDRVEASTLAEYLQGPQIPGSPSLSRGPVQLP